MCEHILSSDEESTRTKTLNKKKDAISERIKSDKNILPSKNDINGISDVSNRYHRYMFIIANEIFELIYLTF